MTDLRRVAIPGGYRCLLADPPWRFQGRNSNRFVPARGADPYPTMAFGDLAALPVPAIAARDAALFLWAIDTHLDQAIDLGRAWGFRYIKVAFWWDKGKMSFGHWSRNEGEPMLLFTRGQMAREPGAGGVRQTIRERPREHSRKPEGQYSRIEALVAGPRVELFAETPRPGWAFWGRPTGRF